MCSIVSGSSTKPLRRLIRNERGVAAIEFAIGLPLLIVCLVAIVELGNAFVQAQSVERGLRAGATYAARIVDVNQNNVATSCAGLSWSSAEVDTIENLVRYASQDSGSVAFYPAVDWSTGTITVDTLVVADAGGSGTDVCMVTIEGSVPFRPLVPGLLNLFALLDIDIAAITIRSTHEQAVIGS